MVQVGLSEVAAQGLFEGDERIDQVVLMRVLNSTCRASGHDHAKRFNAVIVMP